MYKSAVRNGSVEPPEMVVQDIVGRLREQAQAPALAWLRDAAEEIERLRAKCNDFALHFRTFRLDDQTGNDAWTKQGMDDTLQTSQATDRRSVSFDLLVDYPTHADALREIERLRELGDDLVWVMRHGSDKGWDNAIDAWQEARR